MPISPELQQKRREKVLAKTREFIRKSGIKDLNVRDLAKYCGVSVPTLYNQFKNKDGLVVAAADELFRWHYEGLRESAADQKPGWDLLLHLCNATCDLILRNPDFGRLVVRANPGNRSPSSIGTAKNMYIRQVQVLQEQGGLQDWMPAEFIGVRLYDRIRSTTLEWALGNIDDQDLPSVRRCELAIALLAFSNDSLRQELKKVLVAEQRKLQ